MRRLLLWARQWLAAQRLLRDSTRRAAELRKAWATPWGMLDREEWYEIMRKRGPIISRRIHSDEL